MAAVAPSNIPSDRQESFTADLAGMFNFLIDPVAAARRLPRKWFWIAPLLVLCAAAVVYTMVSGPIGLHYAENAAPPANVTAAQYAQQLQIQAKMQTFLPIIVPIFTIIGALIQTGLLLAASSVLAVRAKFLELLNLVAGCSLIGALQMVAWTVILKMKHEISAASEIRPPLGIDIFLPEGTNKFVLALVGYFTIFTIWGLVMMILTYSAGFRVSKGKATTAVLPMHILFLLLALVGAAFQKT